MKINETFASFQGEITVGRYAYFIRLGGCNLNCVFCFGARKNNGKLPYITYSKDKNKRLDKVKKGDVLLTLDENHNLVETTVKEVFEREVNEWYIVKIGKHNYYVTPEHEFFTTKGLKSVKELKINDEIFNVDFKEKISYRMKNNNPMFNQDIVDKSVMNDFLALQHNGIKIKSIKYFNRNNKDKYKYKTSKVPEPLKVFNLRCEPYNTYLADWMWSHNCDTDYARDSYVDMSMDEIYEKAKHFDRVIITGGEPFLQKDDVAKLTKKLINNKPDMKIEIETNGTIKPIAVSNFNNIIYNVSLKLKNSDNSKQDRLKDNVIKWFVQAEANFKFVVKDENDVDEVNMIVTEYGIPKSQVFLMAEGKTTKEQLDRMEHIISFAKQHGYNFTPRFHVLLWGDKRGV